MGNLACWEIKKHDFELIKTPADFEKLHYTDKALVIDVRAA